MFRRICRAAERNWTDHHQQQEPSRIFSEHGWAMLRPQSLPGNGYTWTVRCYGHGRGRRMVRSISGSPPWHRPSIEDIQYRISGIPERIRVVKTRSTDRRTKEAWTRKGQKVFSVGQKIKSGSCVLLVTLIQHVTYVISDSVRCYWNKKLDTR